MRNEVVEIGSSQSSELLRTLANQTCLPLDEVRRVYEMQFQKLESQARIRIYLPILAARHAREVLDGARKGTSEALRGR